MLTLAKGSKPAGQCVERGRGPLLRAAICAGLRKDKVSDDEGQHPLRDCFGRNTANSENKGQLWSVRPSITGDCDGKMKRRTATPHLVMGFFLAILAVHHVAQHVNQH